MFNVPLRKVLYVVFATLNLPALTELHAFTLSVDDVDISIERHPADGEQLVIWLPSEAGPQAADILIANQLSERQVEVWRVDVVEAHFLPVAQSSMDLLPARDISALIDSAWEKTTKDIAVVTTGRGAIPVLRGLHRWQQNRSDHARLTGVILLSPKFFIETPDPGVEGQLMPVVSASNAPVFIIQPEQSPWYWKLPQSITALEQNGSDVYVRILRNVRDRYYFRPDATQEERAESTRSAGMMIQSMSMLNAMPRKVRKPPAMQSPQPSVKVGKKDRSLQVYKGNPLAFELRLNDINGEVVELEDFRGKVVLVNFWASWCPPCVHEMPSMQNLKHKMKNRPFEILGVNMAEDKNTVAEFLSSKVSVDFPILLDIDGQTLKGWSVFAFPTSYVVDKRGTIRYALFGSIEWDAPQIINTMEELVTE